MIAEEIYTIRYQLQLEKAKHVKFCLLNDINGIDSQRSNFGRLSSIIEYAPHLKTVTMQLMKTALLEQISMAVQQLYRQSRFHSLRGHSELTVWLGKVPIGIPIAMVDKVGRKARFLSLERLSLYMDHILLRMGRPYMGAISAYESIHQSSTRPTRERETRDLASSRAIWWQLELDWSGCCMHHTHNPPSAVVLRNNPSLRQRRSTHRYSIRNASSLRAQLFIECCVDFAFCGPFASSFVKAEHGQKAELVSWSLLRFWCIAVLPNVTQWHLVGSNDHNESMIICHH